MVFSDLTPLEQLNHLYDYEAKDLFKLVNTVAFIFSLRLSSLYLFSLVSNRTLESKEDIYLHNSLQ